MRRADDLGWFPAGRPEHGRVARPRDRRRDRTTAPACGRPRSLRPARSSAQEARADPRLADIGAGADDGHHSGRPHDRQPTGSSAPAAPHPRTRTGSRTAPAPATVPAPNRPSASTSRPTSSSPCAADSVTRSRLVPTGTVGGRMAGTHRPLAAAQPTLERGLLAARGSTGTIGLGWPGRCEARLRQPVDQGGEAARQGSTFVGAQDPESGEGGRGVGRASARSRRCTSGPGSRGGRRRRGDAATNPPSEPRVFDSVPTRTTMVPADAAGPVSATRRHPGSLREVGAEDGVGLVEDEQRVVAPAQGDELARAGRRRRPWRTRSRSRRWSAGIRCRRARSPRPAAPPGGPCRRGGRRPAPSGRAGSRR